MYARKRRGSQHTLYARKKDESQHTMYARKRGRNQHTNVCKKKERRETKIRIHLYTRRKRKERRKSAYICMQEGGKEILAKGMTT